jgi:hypothetical protein
VARPFLKNTRGWGRGEVAYHIQGIPKEVTGRFMIRNFGGQKTVGFSVLAFKIQGAGMGI